MLCRGVEGTPTITDKKDAVSFQLIQTDDSGVCLDAYDGSKTDINSIQLSHSTYETVNEEICAAVIASGECPMIAWGILRIEPDTF